MATIQDLPAYPECPYKTRGWSVKELTAMDAHGAACFEAGKLASRERNIADFESWLRTVCFQRPTPEAYDLAKSAWLASKEK